MVTLRHSSRGVLMLSLIGVAETTCAYWDHGQIHSNWQLRSPVQRHANSDTR